MYNGLSLAFNHFNQASHQATYTQRKLNHDSAFSHAMLIANENVFVCICLWVSYQIKGWIFFTSLVKYFSMLD